MASKNMQSTAPRSKQTTNIANSTAQFMDAAGEKFSSFFHQATTCLNRYWPNWNCHDDPKSYIIPPAFDFKYPDVSDAALTDFLKKYKPNKPGSVHKHRKADMAEYLLYAAIMQLSNDPNIAPFIAIRSLNLNLGFNENVGLTGRLIKMFPDMDWKKFYQLLGKPNAEYDFILIGPKIGLTVIEAKSTYCKKEGDFEHRKPKLPDEYQNGLNQLKSFDAMIDLLHWLTDASIQYLSKRDFEWPLIKVRKILFSPNLENKTRYQIWVQSLTEDDQKVLEANIGDAIQWFAEDVQSLKRLLIDNANLISEAQYGLYAPMLATIAAAKPLCTSKKLDIDEAKFSEAALALELHSSIINQNPLECQENRQNRKSDATQLIENIKRVPFSSLKNLKIYFMTPDQQDALDCPKIPESRPKNRFIAGAAGTGKTVVLQIKAVELLEEGETVLIFATKNYVEKYQDLFANGGFDQSNYLVTSLFFVRINFAWSTTANKCFDEKDISLNNLEKHVDLILKHNRGDVEKEFEQFSKYNNIFVDDGLDEFSGIYLFLLPFFSMMLLSKLYPEKLIWIALDPVNVVISQITNESEKTIFTQGLVNFANNKKPWWRVLASKFNRLWGSRLRSTNFDVKIIQQVMRCSENIYDFIYDDSVYDLPLQLLPRIGHKIQGLQCLDFKKDYATLREVLMPFWTRIVETIESFLSFNGDSATIAFIYDIGMQIDECIIRKVQKKWPKITTGKWNEVSSLEWPFVLFVGLYDDYDDHYETLRQKVVPYRAMSRATSKLVNICFAFKKPPHAQQRTENEKILLAEVIKKFWLNQPTLGTNQQLNTGEWEYQGADIDLLLRTDIFFEFNVSLDEGWGYWPVNVVDRYKEIYGNAIAYDQKTAEEETPDTPPKYILDMLEVTKTWTKPEWVKYDDQ